MVSILRLGCLAVFVVSPSPSLSLSLLIFIQYFKKLIIIAVYIMHKRCRHLKYERVECFSFYFIRAFTCTHTNIYMRVHLLFQLSQSVDWSLAFLFCWGCWCACISNFYCLVEKYICIIYRSIATFNNNLILTLSGGYIFGGLSRSHIF